MTSVFKLFNSKDELPSANEGIAKYKYVRKSAEQQVTSDNFGDSNIDFRFSIKGNSWVSLKRSQFRLRGTLTKGNAAALTTGDLTAPVMNWAASLFQSGEFKINEVPISTIPNFFGAIDTVEHRLSKSKAWFDSVGATISWWDANFENRLNDISSDGILEETEIVTSRENMGYNADVTVTYDKAGGASDELITFGGTTPGNTNTKWIVGDYIRLQGSDYPVSAVAAAVTMNLGNGPVSDAQGTMTATDEFYRVRKINKARTFTSFEICWTPMCLSAFKLNHALPLGNYMVSLVPYAGDAWKLRSIESADEGTLAANAVTKAIGITSTTIHASVNSMYLYYCTFDGPRVKDLTYVLDLDETQCGAKAVNAASAAEDQWTVPISTKALTVAFRDLTATSDTRYAVTKMKIRSDQDLNLNRLQVTYGDENKPIPQADCQYTSTLDYFQQRYRDTYTYSGSIFTNAGPESFDDYKVRGPIYHFPFPKDGSSKENQVTVRWGFSALTASITQCLLFAHYKKTATVIIKDSAVESVTVAIE